MENCHLFFMKSLFVYLWMLLLVSTCVVSAQEKDSVYRLPSDTAVVVRDTLLQIHPHDSLNFGADSIRKPPVDGVLPADSLTMFTTGGKPPLDSIPSLPDSLRRRVVIRRSDPLDTLSNRIFAYQVLNSNSYARSQVVIDTTLNRFSINNPVLRNYHAGAYLGNTGLSYYPITFGERKRPSDFHFLDHLADYLRDPETTIYYQTQMPYWLWDFSSAGSKAFNETIVKIVHTQNVNKDWNVGVNYDSFSSVGQYINQSASTNGVTLFSAYRGNQYSMYTNFNWNTVRMRENGGLADLDTYEVNEKEAVSNGVRSGLGKAFLLNRSLYVMHSWSFKKLMLRRNEADTDSIDISRFTIMQTFKYEWNKREFSDTATYAFRGRREPNFGSVYTHDSLYFRRLFNHFELMIKEQPQSKFTAGFSAGILTELDRYNIDIIPEFTEKIIEPYLPQNSHWGGELPMISGTEVTFNYRETKTFVNTAITGRFFNHTGRYLNWDFNGRLYFTGYKPGDVNINGMVQMHYYTEKGRNTLLLGGSIDNAHPGYFLNRFASNWLAWDNNFNASQEIRLRGEFLMPHRKLKLGAYVSQLNNYVYIDTDALPAQTANPLATATAYIEKDIRWRKLGFQFRLYGQYSSDEKIIPLPAFAGFQSTYFETWLVKNVLTMQLGWNVNFHTKYYAYAYMPATGMFYLQEERQIGNYPFFDFFLNLQIKRGRFFIRTDGLNTMNFFRNSIGKENYMAYRYPTNDLRLKVGFSWAFYD